MLLRRKRTGGAAITAGARVEARPSGEDAWYEATVTEGLPGRRGYSIVYATLTSDDDHSQPLRETVRKSRVRPRPPRFSAGAVGCGLHQPVEVYSKGGWRVGVVADVGAAGKYRVSLPDTREVAEFTASNIRPRLVWRHHQWFASDDGGKVGSKFGAGKQVEVSGNTENYGVAWFPGMVVKVIDKATFLVDYNKPQEDGGTNLIGVVEILDVKYIRPAPQPKPQNTVFCLLEEIEVCHCGIWIAGVVSKIVDDSKYVVKMNYGKEEIELNQSDMRIRCNWKNGRWTCSRKRGRPCQLPTPFSPSSPCDIEQTSKINMKCKMGGEQSCEGQVEALQPRKKLRKEVPVTPVMEIEKLATSEGFDTHPNELVTGSFSGEAGLGEDLSLVELSEDPSLHEFSSSSIRVVRGEESLNSKGGGSEHCEREVLAASHGFENPPNELVIGSFRGEPGLEESFSLDELSKDPCLRKCASTGELIVRAAESSNSVGGRSEHSHIVNHFVPSHQTGHDSVLAADRRNFPKGNEMFAIHRRCQEDPNITDARHHSNAEMKKKDMPLKESTESISRMNVSLVSVSSVKTLPFKKSSKMWETVYSMDVFNRMPQDPCFSKLEQHPMNLREGEAIGLIVSFAGLADSVNELRISDPQSAFNEKLEDLKHLEENGFDVLRIRERIEYLLEIRNVLKLIEEVKTKLEYQVSEVEKENEQFGAAEEIDKAIKELEQKLACLYEKRSFVNVQRSKLSSLQKNLQAAKESCQSERDSFERIRYSPW